MLSNGVSEEFEAFMPFIFPLPLPLALTVHKKLKAAKRKKLSE